MEPLRRRLRIEHLEDRTTPSSVADLYWTASYLERLSQDMEWMSHPSARPWVQGYFTGMYNDAMATLPTLSDPAAAGVAMSIASFAQSVSGIAGFSVFPPPFVPPADAGMVSTIPDVNSPSWVNQQNGLKTWDVKVGTGEAVGTGDRVTIFYTGWLLNGTVFDSKRVGSTPPGPIEFDLDNLIEGWKQGIPGMQPGGIRRLYVPFQLAYGDAGKPATPPGVTIPPQADLVFEIKLVSHRN